MHILHTLAGSHLGGMEFRVLEQAQWLKEQGHVVAIAAPPGSETLKAAHERSLEAVGIDFESAYSPSTVLGLRRLVKRLRIEVIDAHSRADGKTSALCQDLCAVVRTRHFAKYLRTSLRKRLEWRVGCHHVIATSGEGRNDIVSAGFAPAERVSVVGEWADQRFFLDVDKAALRQRMRAELGLDADAFVVATIGMLRPEKRQDDLLRVVQQLRQRAIPAIALVVGTPTAEKAAFGPRLRALADELGIAAHTVFAGHRGDIDQVIHAADALLVPSSNEAWSRVVPEAFAAGCPVVVSNVGGLPEIVKPDATGWLAEPGDVAGFTGHVAGIWSDPARARRVVEQARVFAEDNFQLGRKMDETLRAYEVAIRRKRGR
ncbi:glycosyltransferase family 4 protein [Achromobacter sp. 413638]|uniref:glycosyltransferase family 4 protein n=1 Tax=Achromobacter sp. 413638 TaxID=3342385 RepID=UPI003247C9CE